MDIAQPDPALSATADRRSPTFNTVKRGYDPDQVREYLARLTDREKALEEDARQLESQLKVAFKERDDALAVGTSSPGSFESVSSRVTELMMGLDQDVARIRSEAEADAGRILEEANAEAQRTQADAEQMRLAAEETLLKSQRDAERAAFGLNARQESLRAELSVTCSKVLQMIAELDASTGHAPNQVPIVLEEAGDGATSEAAIGPISIPDAPPSP